MTKNREKMDSTINGPTLQFEKLKVIGKLKQRGIDKLKQGREKSKWGNVEGWVEKSKWGNVKGRVENGKSERGKIEGWV